MTRNNQIKPRDLVMLGLCFDGASSYLPGAAKAPPEIRKALYCGSANGFAESGTDVLGSPRFVDAGDPPVGPGSEGYLAMETGLVPILENQGVPMIIGGDHSVTYPVIRAVARFHQPLTILHFDAHPDLYDQLDGNRYSHACPFARIMEEKLAARLIQVGIRTLNHHQRFQARRFGVEIHEMAGFDPTGFMPRIDGPVYLSVDLDVLDPAFAPGVSHHEPGGMSVRDLLGIIQSLESELVGADIVEYNPLRDINRMTAMVAAKLVREIGAKILEIPLLEKLEGSDPGGIGSVPVGN